MERITVFGATGMLGRPVVEELFKAGFALTALARTPERARQLLPVTVNVVKGDLQNAADVERAVEGAEGVYLNLSVEPTSRHTDFQPEREGLASVLAAARKAHVRRVAYCSSLVHRYQGMNGFDWWAFDIKRKAVEAIKESGIPYTIFYPSSFMENFDKGSYRQGNKLLLAGESKFPMYFVAGADYGRQVARSFQTLTGESREYDVQGLEGFTADEAVKVFAEYYQKEKLKVSRAPAFLLKVLALFNQKFDYGARILDALNNYPEEFAAETTWAELGKPTVTLRDYARNS